MLARRLIKFDRQFYVFFVLLVVLFGIIGITAKNIFEAFNISRSVNPALLQSTDVRVSAEHLEEALSKSGDQRVMPLDLPE